MVFTWPVLYELHDIAAPTRLSIGTSDRTATGTNRISADKRWQLGRYDKLGQQAAQLIPDAKLVELNDIGHVPQFEDFQRYIAAFNAFLQDCEFQN